MRRMQTLHDSAAFGVAPTDIDSQKNEKIKRKKETAMKKVMMMVLTLAMILSCAVPAFAVTLGNGEKQTVDVKARYTENITSSTVYSVDVKWDAMEFTYAVSGSKVWNPSEHDYDVTTTSSGWSNNNNEITVTNHSNAKISAEFAFAVISDYSALSGTFSKAKLELPSAEGKEIDDEALTGKTALTLNGALDAAITVPTKVGAVTITILGES